MKKVELTGTDSRNDCPADQKQGVYYVQKKNTIARFTFGKSNSTFRTIQEAHKALTDYLSKRQDAADLRVSLLSNHW